MITRIQNIKQLATCPPTSDQSDIGIIKNAAVVYQNKKIIWLGQANQIPEQYQNADQIIDAKNKLVIPGLIDCHTHLLFAGERSHEFKQRIQGTSYLKIAEQGGGIASTVSHTRDADEKQLYDKAIQTLQQNAALGITTIECKSGYGLTLKDEIKILKIYKTLANNQPLSIVPTFLGAHTLPIEYKNNPQAYIDLIIDQMLPVIKKENLAKFCDVFVEQNAFSPNQARQIIKAAQAHGLHAKLHVDQLQDGQGASLAAELNATSADHLEYISDAGIQALKESGTIAVTLPLASLYTFEKPLDCRRLIHAELPIALATDYNPGSAPTHHLPLAMMLGCTLNRLSPHQVLKATTINAAKAIQMQHVIGSIQVGKNADITIIDAPSINHWMYAFQPNACITTIKDGQIIYEK